MNRSCVLCITPITLVKVFILSMIWVSVIGKKKKKLLLAEEDPNDFDGESFCKNRSRLIRLERSDEFVVVDVFENSSFLLQCKFCEERYNGLPKLWLRQKRIFVGNITEVDMIVNNNAWNASAVFTNKDHSLVFRNFKKSHMGLYFCKAPYVDTCEKSFNYLVDIITKSTEEKKGFSKDLKNYTNEYFMELNEKLKFQKYSVNRISVNMMVYTEWTEWSDCDSCFRTEGVKFRTGKCRVRPLCLDSDECIQERKRFKNIVFSSSQNTERPMTSLKLVEDVSIVEESIMEFGIALSCRSFLLKELTPILYNLTSKIPNFILYEKCNAPCRGRGYKKGPRYRKSIILARGAHLTLVCPDSSIDSEVRWEHNRLRLKPNEGADYIPGSTEPRLYVDSFNTLYLFEVTNRESGNFTCFVDGKIMQEVKIIVLTRSLFFTKEFTRHIRYLGFVFVICFIGYLAGVTLMCVREKTDRMKTINKKVVKKCDSDETKKLLATGAVDEDDEDDIEEKRLKEEDSED